MNIMTSIQDAIHAPGIYLNMPEDEYHADPSLSASGIKLLTVSPLDYWVNSPHLNANRVEKTSDALDLGKAYHKIILEGRAAFDAEFCVSPAKEDYPDALDGAESLRAYCKSLELKTSGTIAEMCQRIREQDASVELWPEIKDAFDVECAGRKTLTKAQWSALRLVEIVVNRMPSTKDAFGDGFPEVSMFWQDELGMPMKARVDYLKPKTMLDLKTFANIMSKETLSAVANEVARNRYFIQPIVYRRGLRAMKALYKVEGATMVRDADTVDERLHAALTDDRERFHFVFVQTGGVPNVVIREFSEFETYGGNGATQNASWWRGEAEFRRGVALYKQCMAEFKTGEPWVADFGRKQFKDADFPVWMLNNPEVSA